MRVLYPGPSGDAVHMSSTQGCGSQAAGTSGLIGTQLPEEGALSPVGAQNGWRGLVLKGTEAPTSTAS